MAQERWHIPTCDEGLVDCFLEEVGELLAVIDSQLKVWTADPGDQPSLTQVRRCFHTIKGSGRMVKALDLSEVAWKVERMLNQALAGFRSPNPWPGWSRPSALIGRRLESALPPAVERLRNKLDQGMPETDHAPLAGRRYS